LPLFLATLLTSRALARRALAPMSRMTEQADEVSRLGALRLLGGSDDPAEVAALAAAFNRVLARLEAMLRAERHFAEDAAHELRTPLTVISGELEHAVADPTLGDSHRRALAFARAETERMAELVDALLLLRRAEGAVLQHEPESLPVNLADLARDVTDTWCRKRPERRQDVAVVSPDEALVKGQSTLLTAAVRNLVHNALKFTAPGQPVRITVTPGQTLSVVAVEDGGSGIRPEDSERVFDPFFRGREARAEHDGFGLGLPLLRRVARAHGGDILLTRSDLGGARFDLRLPTWSPGTG
jgi:signal transduction histidine kinase